MCALVRRAALAVWRALGPHLSESVYQRALCVELRARAAGGGGAAVAVEQVRPILHRSVCVGHHRLDVVLGPAILEIKSQHRRYTTPAAHQPQVLRYLFHRNPGEYLVLVVFHPVGVATTLYT